MSESTNSKNVENKVERPKSHRVFAWIAIILLMSMYIVTLVSAIIGGGYTSELFMMCLGASIVLPGLLWLYIRFWNFSMKRDRKTFGVDTESDIASVAKGEYEDPED